MPYISATELIMYAPCFLRLPISPTVILVILSEDAKKSSSASKDLHLLSRFKLVPLHRIDQVRQPIVHDLALQLHSIPLRHTPRWHILRANQRDHLARLEGMKRHPHARLCRFCRLPAPPLVTEKVKPSLHRRLTFDVLLDDP